MSFEIIVVDSESTDDTRKIFEEAGARIAVVQRQTFHHAATRNRAATMAEGDVLVFLTQDAVPANSRWLRTLIAPLSEGPIAASFARQIPYPAANPVERYARLRNYPPHPHTVSIDDVAKLGIRAFFFSNSCSAIRRDVFEELGGFPTHTIMNEDMLFAFKLLESGHAIAYVADAIVEHSHDYTTWQTFQRYFDIGVVFEQAKEELSEARVTSEGVRYVRQLFTWLGRNGHYSWFPRAVLESAAKWTGTFLGRRYKSLPLSITRQLSMHRGYWTARH